MSPFELSSCCSFHVLPIILPSSYSWNEGNVRHFCFHNQLLNLVPRASRLTVHLPARKLYFWLHRFINSKILPNLIISGWLWWIMRLLLANQNWGNILNEQYKVITSPSLNKVVLYCIVLYCTYGGDILCKVICSGSVSKKNVMN